eukprot:scaffold10109_cov144-Skeletonema_dohrnii-CCMP3373.AAC.7
MSQGKSTIPDIHRGDGDGDGKNKSKDQTLCSSCDSCRAKKTKCDGKRPCEACMVSYVRRNKIGSADEVDVKKIKCVYSPAKRRGPPPKRTLEREMEERERERKQRREEEHPIAGLGRVPEEVVSSAANLNNLDTASILNLLSMLNPATSTLPPPMPPPIDPQQSLLSSLGNALAGIQGIGMPQGFGGGATASGGYNTMNNAPSAASQQLAYLQQLQQQLQLQQLQQQLQENLQQQLQQQQQQQQPLTQQGQTTRGAESSMSSSLEDNRTQSLQNEVGRLRKRIHELETENAELKQKVDALQKAVERAADEDDL